MTHSFAKDNVWKRVDIQVALFTAVIVALLTCSISIFQYIITYQDTLKTLNGQVDSIYHYLEPRLNLTTFNNISDKQDIQSPIYQEMHTLFKQAREITGVKYLYTAKQDENGDFIYVIDCLDPANPEFRYPGDTIEPEISLDMQRALHGEEVRPNGIKDTEWGKIFISYLPVYHQDSIIGVIGIEFIAEHQFLTFRNLRLMLPVFIILFSLIACLISHNLFRQISNPFYKDMANTDYLTQLKNRNAYQLDITNMIAIGTQKGKAIIAIDLNSLKKLNDSMGHEAGDRYITCISNAYHALNTKEAVMYRVGGDEFVLLVPNATEAKIDQLMQKLEEQFHKLAFHPSLSFSWGYAIYDEKTDADLNSTYRRADKAMYAKKQEYYRPHPDSFTPGN